MRQTHHIFVLNSNGLRKKTNCYGERESEREIGQWQKGLRVQYMYIIVHFACCFSFAPSLFLQCNGRMLKVIVNSYGRVTKMKWTHTTRARHKHIQIITVTKFTFLSHNFCWHQRMCSTESKDVCGLCVYMRNHIRWLGLDSGSVKMKWRIAHFPMRLGERKNNI